MRNIFHEKTKKATDLQEKTYYIFWGKEWEKKITGTWSRWAGWALGMISGHPQNRGARISTFFTETIETYIDITSIEVAVTRCVDMWPPMGARCLRVYMCQNQNQGYWTWGARCSDLVIAGRSTSGSRNMLSILRRKKIKYNFREIPTIFL